jgi:hypothetical protein
VKAGQTRRHPAAGVNCVDALIEQVATHFGQRIGDAVFLDCLCIARSASAAHFGVISSPAMDTTTKPPEVL